MPHFIIEYTANLEADLHLERLFDQVHAALIGMRLFPTGGIRSRAYRVDRYRFADGARDYAGVHVQLKLSSARSPQVRREAGEAVFEVLSAHCAPIQARRLLALSMEVSVFEQDLFFNQNNLHPLFGPAPEAAPAQTAIR